jgi:type III pantothenate kinase
LILADIGNGRVHLLLPDGRVVHTDISEALSRYGDVETYYISVRRGVEERLAKYPMWRDISSLFTLPGSYEGMGADRKALCLSRGDGIYVDAGSAVTVDIVRDGRYGGGFIYPGIEAMKRAYASISPALDLDMESEPLCDTPPYGTKKQISYGIIAPLVSRLKDMKEYGAAYYFCGGDGEFLSSCIDGAVFCETLVFEGMRRVVRDSGEKEK